jgi:hypothetical protein
VYEKPTVTDLGSISDHTWNNPGKGDKMDEPINYHYDKFCEFSGCYAGGCDPDHPLCANVPKVGQPG